MEDPPTISKYTGTRPPINEVLVDGTDGYGYSYLLIIIIIIIITITIIIIISSSSSSNSAGGKEAEGVWEQGVEENIWT